eukprot:1160781-Pelagomonas_calceolata.AAC.25
MPRAGPSSPFCNSTRPLPTCCPRVRLKSAALCASVRRIHEKFSATLCRRVCSYVTSSSLSVWLAASRALALLHHGP